MGGTEDGGGASTFCFIRFGATGGSLTGLVAMTGVGGGTCRCCAAAFFCADFGIACGVTGVTCSGGGGGTMKNSIGGTTL